MKQITEMTEQEILSLTDEQLENLIKYGMAEEGIKILDRPKEPKYFEVPAGDVIAYKVGGFDKLFIDQKDAQSASEFILSLKKNLREDSYGKHYSLKFLTSDNYGFENIGNVQPLKFYSRELIEKIEGNYSTNESLKKAYEKSLKEYNENYESAEFIREEIYDRFREVQDKYRNMEHLLNTYTGYLNIAEGNSEIAMNFLKKAYTVDAEAESYIVNNLNEKVLSD